MTARGVRVLVVEDDEAAARVVRLNLERQGFEVERAAHGADALRMLDERRPEVLLSDHVMPGMTGLELLDALRGRTPDLQAPGLRRAGAGVSAGGGGLPSSPAAGRRR